MHSVGMRLPSSAIKCQSHERSHPFGIQDQDRYNDIGSSLGLPEARSHLLLPELAPSPTNSESKTVPGVATQGVHILKALAPDEVCTCATCLHERGWHARPQSLFEHPERPPLNLGCRVTGCEWTTGVQSNKTFSDSLDAIYRHESEIFHYGKPGSYKCREVDCKFTTKRLSDLKRHCSSKHCINPQNFRCPDLSCKYHQIGFARKDKLNDHYQKAHEGRYHPGKPNRVIKPKVGDDV